MRDYNQSSEIMERIINKYNQAENRKRCYGTDTVLTRKEIHTIYAIGKNSGINVTQLAKLQGVTKGAVSQMIYKLVEKGYVKKSVSMNSDSEVMLELTTAGCVAYEAHNQFHKETQEDFFLLLKNMPEETYQQMLEILIAFEKSLDKRT